MSDDLNRSWDADILSRYSFLKDASLSDDLKKFLLDKSIEVRNSAWTKQLEERKWRWSTPLAVALTGLITMGGNFLFDYWKTTQTQTFQERSGDVDATRKAKAVEREFEFKIVERELSQAKSEAERARVLLFLVRAGVLNGLNASELKVMAEASLAAQGKEADSIGVPSLGAREPRALDDNFRGRERRVARLSIGSGPVESFRDLKDLLASLPSDSVMTARNPRITVDANSPRVTEEQRNVKVRGFVYAAARDDSGDYQMVIGRASNAQPSMYINATISGLPPKSQASYATLRAARDKFKDFFGSDLPDDSYEFYRPPIPVEIEGSLFFNVMNVGQPTPADLAGLKTNWEIRPITKIVFEP
jgi:hypothetical protein